METRTATFTRLIADVLWKASYCDGAITADAGKRDLLYGHWLTSHSVASFHRQLTALRHRRMVVAPWFIPALW